MTTAGTTPKAVRKYVQTVTHEIGEEPTVTRTDVLRWRVALDGEHVHASADFEAVLGKTKWVRGALEVDGEMRDPLPWGKLRKLWDDLERGDGEGARLDPVPPMPDGAVMPPEVARLHDQLVQALDGAGEKGVTVTAGFDGQRWAVAILFPGSNDGARFAFAEHAGRWLLDGKPPIQVVVSGVDVSAGIGTDIRKALDALTGNKPGSGPQDPPQGQLGRGKRDIGIEYRKGNVLRI